MTFKRTGVKSIAVAMASPVPVHWAEKMKADLERDVILGVIEREYQSTL